MISISIVIQTLDRKEMLVEALDSVVAQCDPAVEIVVVDGGSTDGTLELLGGRPDIRVLTGPDAGVYDAINKGIACASGDVVGLLNSDDRYEPGAFAAVRDILERNSDADAACGAARLVEGERVLAVFDDALDLTLASPRSTLIGACIPNARFFRRPAMTAVGPFSLGYRYIADRDWLTRWYEAGLRTAVVPRPVYRYRQHAESLTFNRERHADIAIREELLALADRWRRDASASAPTRRIAELLDGRCRFVLAIEELRKGDAAAGLMRLVKDGERWSAKPAAMIAGAAVDWTLARLSPRRSF